MYKRQVDNGKPVQKPWRIKTTSANLAESLSQYRCQCPPGAHAACQGKITAASNNYTPKMAQVVINALVKPTFNTATSNVSRPSIAPVELDALCGTVAQDAWLDLSFATEEAEERGLIGRSQYDIDGNSPSTSSSSHTQAQGVLLANELPWPRHEDHSC